MTRSAVAVAADGAATVQPPPLPARTASSTATAWAVFTASVAATLVRGTGPFAYDAYGYWTAALRVAGAAPDALPGFWKLRGVLSGFVYAPAAALSRLAGLDVAGFAVLLQNALLLAWVAAFLVPRAAAQWHPLSRRGQCLAAVLVWLAVSGFARYPLVDLYAAVGCLTVTVLLRSRRRSALVLAGLVAGAAMNVRPAYVATVIAIVVIAVAWHRWAGALVPIGVGVALVPQVVLNRVGFDAWSVSPVGTDKLMGLQAGYAAYITRYDTLLDADPPMQFYCSPGMASRVATPPDSIAQLIAEFVGNAPTAALFAMEKVASALLWPQSAPYGTRTPGVDALFAAFITTITIVGIAALVRVAVRAGRTSTAARRRPGAAVAALILGAVATVVGAAAETRFALPLVLVGLVGCTTLADVELDPRGASRRTRAWVLGTLAVTVAVTAIGYLGLADPAPPGAVDLATCAAQK